MNHRSSYFLACIIGILTSCGQTTGIETEVSVTQGTSGSHTFKAEIWGDNWFAFYLGDQLVKEDSVSIRTERSFNSESFTFKADYPLQLNIVAKDFKENDTGLEYIGSRRQQMGDGGIIAQFTNVDTGEVIAVTDRNWKSFVSHTAPLDVSCADSSNPVAGEGPCGFVALDEPANWKALDFAGDGWKNATEHSERAVRPKGGYDTISWNSAAKIIWGADLEKDNTVLLRFTVTKP